VDMGYSDNMKYFRLHGIRIDERFFKTMLVIAHRGYHAKFPKIL